MTVRLYDSRAQALRDFEPLVPGKAGIYVCGPTVQSSPHIGHLRSALAYDLWRRWLEYRGYDVTFVRNVTDIDDKILDASAQTGTEEWWALAYRIELEFTAGYNALGMLAPTYEPRATASVPQMQDIIQTLIDAGHAYVADDNTGDVYFDVKTWDAYGVLTNQKLDDMEDSPDAAARGKRDPRDFALWKGTKTRRAGVGVVGLCRGVRVVRDGTSSARRCRSAIWVPPSTSMAAVSICGSRTTRTSSRSRPPREMRSRATGCTTAW